MESHYSHVQQQFVLPVVLAAFLALVVALMAADDTVPSGAVWGAGAVCLFIVAVGAHFSRMKVAVDAEWVTVAFGSGWPRRRIRRAEIVSVAAVRNRWFYGFGIRWIPGGSLWNVWGLDAAELLLEGGRRFRIGSDDTDALVRALQ